MPSLDPRPDLRLEPNQAVAAVPRLGPGDDGRAVSAEAFAAARFEPPWLYERTDGRLRVVSPEGWEHVENSEPWRDRLGAYALARPDVVRRVASHAWVRIDAKLDRIGDIGVYLAGGPAGVTIPDLVPDLVFEFVSPSRVDRERDYVSKRSEYERIGVAEYVIVDRFERRVAVLSLRDGAYVERVIGSGGVYQSPLLPGLAVPLAEVGL